MKTFRDAFKLYLAITAVEWFLDSLFSTVSFVYRAVEITSDPLQLTLIEVFFTATLIISEIPTGVIADVYSRRLSVILGFAFTGVAALLQGAFPTLGVMLLSQVIWAIGFTFISGAKDAWIADEIGEERAGMAFLRGSQVSQIALLVGIPIATALGSIALNLPIVIAGVGHLLLMFALIFVMPEEGFEPTVQTERATWKLMFQTFSRGVKLVRGHAVLIAILTISVIFGMSSMGFDNLWTVHMLENIPFPAIGNFEPVVWFGAFNMIVSILGLLGTEVVTRKVDLSHQKQIVQALSFLTGAASICMVVFGFTGNFWLAAAMYCACLTFRTVSMPLFTTWINQNVESNVRATILSMEEQFFSLGETVGGPALGALGSLVSLPAALIAAGLVRLSAAFVFLRFLVTGKQAEPEAEIQI